LDADGTCKELVQKLHYGVYFRDINVLSPSTASYFTAHKNLNAIMLVDISIHTAMGYDKHPKTINN